MSQINPKEIIDRKIIIPCEFTQIQQVGTDLTISQEVTIPQGRAFNVLFNDIQLNYDGLL